MHSTRHGTEKAPPPSNDPRWLRVQQIMLRHGYQPNALIEVLHAIQREFGYLDRVALRFVSEALQIPPSQVYGVATFYHLFSLNAPGSHTCMVCTGTACHLQGAERILQAVEETFGLKPGDTTPDGNVSLAVARCLSFCGPAPVVEFDQEPDGHVTPEGVVLRLRGWINHDS